MLKHQAKLKPQAISRERPGTFAGRFAVAEFV